MRTNDENKMFKLYESTSRKKQMIAYIVESTRRNPWLFFDEQGPVPGATDPTAGAELGADPTAGALTGGEDPEKAQKLQALQTALMDLSAEELIELMQKVVVAQQEAAAGGATEGGGEDPLASLDAGGAEAAPAGIPPTV